MAAVADRTRKGKCRRVLRLGIALSRAALLVGERTYGKCLTQTLQPLSNGGAIRFSNGRLYSPECLPYGDSGLTPDVWVKDAGRCRAREFVNAGILQAPLAPADSGKASRSA